MRKILILLLLAAAIVPATAGTSWACSCVPSSMRKLVDRAEVVFSGTATDVSGDRRDSSATFEVADGFKGGVSGEVVVHTPASAAACGVVFEPGRSYTVLADRNGPAIETNSCTGTKPGAIDLSGYGLAAQTNGNAGPGSSGEEASSRANWQWPAGAVVAILIGVGLIASVRRLRPRAPTTSDSP